MTVRLSPAAQRQLSEIRRYIGDRNPAGARNVIRAIRGAAKALETFPQRHREGSVPGTREFVVPRYPYVIVYRVGIDRIDVLGVFHAARHPSARTPS